MRKDERKNNTELVFESLRCYNIEKSYTSFVAIIDYIEYNKKKDYGIYDSKLGDKNGLFYKEEYQFCIHQIK